MYHRVGEDSFDPWGLSVSFEHFINQMEWVASRRTVLGLGEFTRRHAAQDLPTDAIAITFDDGYASTLKSALPVLERLGLPATIFLPTMLVERAAEFWWDELEELVLGTSRTVLNFDGRVIELGDESPQDREWAWNAPPRTKRQRAFHIIWAGLRVKPPAELDMAMKRLREQAERDVAPRECRRPVTRDEVRSAKAALIEWGSHALNHPSLPRLSTRQKQEEIGRSVEQCAAITGARPTTFAYPYGDHDHESKLIVESAGFSCACTTEHRWVDRDASAFALPRFQCGNWSARGLSRMLGHS